MSMLLEIKHVRHCTQPKCDYNMCYECTSLYMHYSETRICPACQQERFKFVSGYEILRTAIVVYIIFVYIIPLKILVGSSQNYEAHSV